MFSEGWDQTNFGLFSGDDGLGGVCGKRVYEQVADLGAQRLVISECGHGYRSTRHEAVNWSGNPVEFVMESSVNTMLRYLKEGKIKVDPAKNSERVTYHDSCNLARSCGIYEEPRELLRMVTTDFEEMVPNRTENYCCTGGGGAMSMEEYAPRRLESAKVKADQLRATGAKVVVTSCHNCVDGLADVIKHYKLDMEVKQLVDLVADALVLPDEKAPVEPIAEEAAPAVHEQLPMSGRTVLVVDDEEDVREFLKTVFEDAGATVVEARDGDEALAVARAEHPDLITLDLSMPGKDGVEAFADFRRDPETQETPVCVVTGHPEFRKVVYDRAVPPPEGYLEKPVDEDKLVAYAAHILEVRDKKQES
jgi:CheY-like chemotaxis protein